MSAQKWNLQDIRPPEPRKRKVVRPKSSPARPEAASPEPRPTAPREEIPSIVIEDGNAKSSWRLVISIFLFLAIVGSAVGLTAAMGKTELTVYAKHRQPNVSSEFTAYPDRRENALSYEILTIEATQESQVKAAGQVQVEELATGVIEIVKTTPGAQRLRKTTRFRSPDGLIVRISESAVVPGAVRDETGALVPGRIQAEVYADEIGEEYNLPAGTKFDIPGFEEAGDTALFEAITAANPTPFSGGFNGPQFQIEESELSTARQALQVELRNQLINRIGNEIPPDTVWFPEGVAITYNTLPPVEFGQDLVTIREQAILQIPFFLKNDFGNFIAAQTVPTYEGNPVRVDDTSVFTFSYTSATTAASVIANEPSLTFRLEGRPLLIWEYDEAKLQQDLATLPKTAINNVVLAYPGIEGMRAHITPFWQRTFPENPEEIIVIEELRESE